MPRLAIRERVRLSKQDEQNKGDRVKKKDEAQYFGKVDL